VILRTFTLNDQGQNLPSPANAGKQGASGRFLAQSTLFLSSPQDRAILLALVLLLLCRGFIQFGLYRAGYISLTADEFSRTVLAARWMEHPSWIWVGAWLPLHIYMLGTALFLGGDLLWAPRLLTLFSGAASILLMYRLASSLFDSPKVGLLSAFILSLNPAHVWLAGTPLSEAPNAMFLLAAIWMFSLYLKNTRQAFLFTAACCLALANGLRFESWLISILFSLVVLGECVLERLRRCAPARRLIQLISAAAIPWIFPAGWLIGNYIETRNPFYSLQAIKAYKFQWYAHNTAYGTYIETFLRIDPYLTVLGMLGIVVCLLRYKKSKPVRWYAAAATIPLAVNILLQGGQVEPPGNYIRYLALFTFLLVPAFGYLVAASAQGISPKAYKIGLVLFLGLVGFTQIRTTFRFSNDPSADGLAVGLAIRELRAQNPAIADRPVIIELAYWQYLAIVVGANDMEGVLYDRVKGTVAAQNQSLLLTDASLFQSCLGAYHASYVIVKDPPLREAVESKLKLQPAMEVNGYTFYPTDDNLSTLTESSPRDCPLSGPSDP
jgi:hypothetical protein